MPFILILLGANITIFYFTTKWENMEKDNVIFWFRYVPSIARSLALVIIAKIYDLIAKYSTYLENRKQEDIYELIMSIKVFAFRLISDFTAVIYSAIVTRDIFRLKTLLYTHILIKYLSEIGLRFFYTIILNHFFKRIYFKKVHKKTKEHPINNSQTVKDFIHNNIQGKNKEENNNNNINNEKIYKENIKYNENDLKLKENNITTQRSNNQVKSEEKFLTTTKKS